MLRTETLQTITVPYSELAIHLKIAGKKAKIVRKDGNWIVVEIDGQLYEGLVSELVDFESRKFIS